MSNTNGNWVTINGTHVFIENGVITKGPSNLIGNSQKSNSYYDDVFDLEDDSPIDLEGDLFLPEFDEEEFKNTLLKNREEELKKYDPCRQMSEEDIISYVDKLFNEGSIKDQDRMSRVLENNNVESDYNKGLLITAFNLWSNESDRDDEWFCTKIRKAQNGEESDNFIKLLGKVLENVIEKNNDKDYTYDGVSKSLKSLGYNLDERFELYRGLIVPKDFSFKIGDKIDLKGTSSWTDDYLVARDFTDYGNRVILKSLGSSKKKVFKVGALNSFRGQDEKEYLVSKDYSPTVIEIEPLDFLGTTVVTVE